MKNVLWLDEIEDEMYHMVGSKAFRLAQLKRNGFPVADGFVIPTVTSHSLTSQAEHEIASAFQTLNASVAVRSSATAEDLKDASFAGQMESFLNVNSENLMLSIKNCVASLHSPRAIYYRNRKGIDHSKVSMAVLVQKMVNARKAGVAFSVSPISKNSNEMLIEVVEGLGIAMVSGRSMPDTYTVEKNNLQIKCINGECVLLDADETKQIVDMVKKIEQFYGSPQDVEWAFDQEGRLIILQTRPITT